MDLLNKHLKQYDINGYETYVHNSSLKEYVTCVKPRLNANQKSASYLYEDKWHCMEDAYERFCDIDSSYDYKIIPIYKMPMSLKKKLFEFNHKDHTLYVQEPWLKSMKKRHEV